MQIPDFFTELTGWRKFNTREGGRVLVSANHPQPWHGAEMPPAVCLADTQAMVMHAMKGPVLAHRPEEGAPALNCTCGYYAYKTKDLALQHAQGSVLARVALWGRVAEHQRGYRAERIRIAAIVVPIDTAAEAIAGLQTRYAVSVTAEEFPSWISENPFGLSTLSQLQHQSASLGQAIANQNYNLLYQHALQNYLSPPPKPIQLGPPPSPPSTASTDPAISWKDLRDLMKRHGW